MVYVVGTQSTPSRVFLAAAQLLLVDCHGAPRESSMPQQVLTPTDSSLNRLNLARYSPQLEFKQLPIGIDNIRFDVYLSPKFVAAAGRYLKQQIRQVGKLEQVLGQSHDRAPAPEASNFRKLLGELLQQSLTRAKYEKDIEWDLVIRVALLKFLSIEIGTQFNHLILECKEWIRARGEHFERSEQAHILKARLAEFQASRRNVFRRVGQTLWSMLKDTEETHLLKTRRALFGESFSESYDQLLDRLVFVESGRDDQLFLDHYVLLGNYVQDPDRFEAVDKLFVAFFQERVLEGEYKSPPPMENGYRRLFDEAVRIKNEMARLREQRESLQGQPKSGDRLRSYLAARGKRAEAQLDPGTIDRRLKRLQSELEALEPKLDEAKRKTDFMADQRQAELDAFLDCPDNARILFDESLTDCADASALRGHLRDDWLGKLEVSGILTHLFASYEVRPIATAFCPPVHLQQLRKALVARDELRKVEGILRQFPTRQLSLQPIEEAAKRLKKYSRDQIRALLVHFMEDFMRLRRDIHDHQRLVGAMERINLVRTEQARELSRLNNSLIDCLFTEEALPAEDRVLSHAIIKADVRGSTQITQDLLAKNLNPAAYFSMNLYEPLRRVVESYGAAKVFIEGDAIVLAIFESESNRMTQRPVARACALARDVLVVSRSGEARSDASGLPTLELGLGIAFQSSAPTYWVDGDSRIMISKALNLSDRLSSCSKLTRRFLSHNPSPFNLFVFQTVLDGAADDETEELLIRFNVNGIELNGEGYDKLSEEISLAPVSIECLMPWGKEGVPLLYGELPIGDGFKSIVVRKGVVREIRSGGMIGGPTNRHYYEVCTSPSLIELVQSRIEAGCAAH